MKYILTTVLAFLSIWVPTLQASPPCGVQYQYQYQSYPIQQQYYQYQTYNNLVAVLPAVFVPAASYTVGYAFAPKEEQKQELKLKESDDKLDKILHAVSGLDAKISAQDARISALESRINAGGGGSSPGSSEWREPRLPQRSPEPIPAKPKQQPQSKLLGAGDVLAVACASCHRSPEKKGGFTYSAAENLTVEQKEKILESVAANKMPPRTSPQLTPEARRTLLQYMAK